MKMQRKNKKWLNAVGSLPQCALCGSYEALQVAHRNESKGMGLKTPDWLTARLCASCHYEIDNGKELSKAERRALMDRAIVNTLDKLVQTGAVVIYESGYGKAPEPVTEYYDE